MEDQVLLGKARITRGRSGSSAVWRVWILVLLVPIFGAALIALEAGLDDAVIPNYIVGDGNEDDEALGAYAEQVGVSESELRLDTDAVEELQVRGVNPCSAIGGSPSVPADLASSTPMRCVQYDTHGGLLYVLAASAIAVLGGAFYALSRNRVGQYIIFAALIDVVGGVASAYGLRGLVIDPGSLPLPYVAAAVGSVAWIALLVVVVPRLIISLPSGGLRSDRWRWAIRATYLAAGWLLIVQWLHPFLLGPIANPVSAPWSVSTANSVFDIGIQVWMVLVVISIIAPILNLVGWARERSARDRANV